MPRKSAAALSVVTLPSGAKRLTAPKTLTPRQKAHFEALVSTKPAGFFHPCDEPLIIQLSRHLARADEVETQFRKEGLDVETFDQLSRLADRESKQITSLMTRLRLTPQARYRPDSQKLDGVGDDRPKPWEMFQEQKESNHD